MSLAQRRVERSRLEVAELALGLSIERGWDNITVADLVAVSEVSSRTFYRYFARKEDVFEPLLRSASERLQVIFRDCDDPDIASRSAAALAASLQTFVPGGIEAVHLGYRILLNHADLRPVWLAAAYDAEPLFATTLNAAFPELDDGHEGRLIAAIIITAQRVALVDWAGGPSTDSLRELAERAIRTGLHALGNPATA